MMDAARATSAKKRLPAFGRQTLELRQQGFAPTGWLVIQRTWPKAPRPWTVVVPSTADPTQFDLSMCTGLSVAVVCCNDDVGNGALVGLVEAAKPSFLAVVCDGECTGAFLADGSPLAEDSHG